jgi:urea transport system permease protein
MFALQVGFMSPSFVGIVPSIEMVIFAAVGGRMSLVGAVYGTLLVNFGKTYFSESFPDLWLFLMAGAVHRRGDGFPERLAGLYESHVKPRLARRSAAQPTRAATGMGRRRPPARLAAAPSVARRILRQAGKPRPDRRPVRLNRNLRGALR